MSLATLDTHAGGPAHCEHPGALRSSEAQKLPWHAHRDAAGRRQVAPVDVVDDHTVGAEAPRQTADRAFHAADPPAREPVAVHVEKQGQNFPLERAVERLRVAGSLHGRVRMDRARAYRETILAVVRFGPPAVEY